VDVDGEGVFFIDKVPTSSSSSSSFVSSSSKVSIALLCVPCGFFYFRVFPSQIGSRLL
jgi:hypothetical protein